MLSKTNSQQQRKCAASSPHVNTSSHRNQCSVFCSPPPTVPSHPPMTSLPNLQTRLQLQPQDSPSQSITYERRQPFHPLKLYDTLSAWFVFSDAAQGSTIAGGNSHGAAVQQTRKHTTGLYVEGVVWLATRPDIAGQLVVHQNGTATLQHDKPWLAALPASAWGPEDHAAAASVC